jgi:hypothetical protein
MVLFRKYRCRGARSSVVEHLTFNQRVDGSIPSGLTNNTDAKVIAGTGKSYSLDCQFLLISFYNCALLS